MKVTNNAATQSARVAHQSGKPADSVGRDTFAASPQGQEDFGHKLQRLESSIFNWSKTLPADPATPDNLDYNDPKVARSFNLNLATNAAIGVAMGAAYGSLFFTAPAALAVGVLALAAAPLI